MQIIAHTGGIAQTNCYLVADEKTGEAVLFDAPDHTVAPVLDYVVKQGWRLTGLWLTHGHFDHLADHAAVREKFPDVELRIHAEDLPMLRAPQSTLMRLPFEIPPADTDLLIADGHTLRIGDIELNVIHTPGHSPGHVCYHFPEQKVLVGGDLILMNAVGRTDLPGSDLPTLMASLRRIMQLPPETSLLPGHGTAGTLGDEREMNPYVAQALRSAG